MDADQFRVIGKQMVDKIADYWSTIEQRRVFPVVEAGYLPPMLPEEAPQEPETFDDVMNDVERVIMPGVTHWHHPQFHAYFPTAQSSAALCGDMLSNAIGCIGFSWAASPACTELEMVVMDWLAKMLKLPDEFLFSAKKKGGGVIQGTASEATLVSMLAARNKKLNEGRDPSITDESGNPRTPIGGRFTDADRLSRLVAYTSDQSHSSVERAALLAAVRCIKIDTESTDLQMTGSSLERVIQRDLQRGLVPFYVCATLGTTAVCAFDRLKEIGPVAERHNMWLHVDAAYAGSAFILPEYRPLLDGIEYCDSFDFNAHKWMLVNFDASCMWFKDSSYVVDAFNVNPLYLKHEAQGLVPDYRHWQIPLGRKFRSLKIWFVLRMLGVSGIQRYLRKQIALAKHFEKLVGADPQFEIFYPVTLGLVCFRLRGKTNEVNEAYQKAVNKDGRIHLVPSSSHGEYFLRFAVCSYVCEEENVTFAWRVLKEISLRYTTEFPLAH